MKNRPDNKSEFNLRDFISVKNSLLECVTALIKILPKIYSSP